MDAIKLLVVFFFMLLLIFKFKRSLTTTFALGCLAVAVAYRFDPFHAVTLAVRSAFSKSTLVIVAVYYSVTFLQKMMEQKGTLSRAQDALLAITNSKRISAAFAPLFVGLMPSPGAVVLGGAMVNSIYREDVGKEDKNFITSFFRHIPESFVPIYGSVVLACELAGVPLGRFVLYMLPVVMLLLVLGYAMILRRMPDKADSVATGSKMQEAKSLLLSLWPVACIVATVIVTNIDAYLVTIVVIVLYYFVNSFRFDDIKPFFTQAFEPKIILSTIFILIFKDYILTTDAVTALPLLIAALPLPDYLVFSIIFFVGSVLVGSTAITAIGIPLAYAAMPAGGTPLLILLSSMAFAAMQVSISHICLFLSSEYFGVDVSSLIKKTVPVIALFCPLLVLYYLLLCW